MILYDKNTKFIGVSADILAVLGYEDMNAFMAYNNDVADLFVNKQGYVHKFDDFSWINYVLNGSLPSKNVIIKQRSGGEIGASISITEILLSNAKDDKCYLVSLSDIRYIDIKSDENTDKNKQPIFKIKNEEPVTAKVDFNNLAENNGGAKVTFIMDEEQDMSASFAAANFNDNRTEYQEKKFFADEPLNQNETKKEKETISVKIDIQEVSDILGISRDDVVRYMKEYASYLEESVKSLHALYENKEMAKIKSILANLIGIGSNLRIKELIQSFQKLLSVDTNTDKSETLKELEEIASEFKQSALKL
ncbi:MAG: hypothetical protein LBF71_04225 [Campylobacteraceae bacterium]|nr:hypothetical protein [Campylobacteraceae bacterium]